MFLHSKNACICQDYMFQWRIRVYARTRQIRAGLGTLASMAEPRTHACAHTRQIMAGHPDVETEEARFVSVASIDLGALISDARAQVRRKMAMTKEAAGRRGGERGEGNRE